MNALDNVISPDIPKYKNYPQDAVQCNNCGGRGCVTCNDKGWLTPQSHPNGRRCVYDLCGKPMAPNRFQVYCSIDCAIADA